MNASAVAMSAYALTVAAQELPDVSGVWELLREGASTKAFGFPQRSSAKVCRVKVLDLPEGWNGGEVTEHAIVQTYFAVTSAECAAVPPEDYKFLRTPVEEMTLPRLVAAIQTVVASLDGDGLWAFEERYGRGADPAEHLNYQSLDGIGISEVDLEPSKYELFFVVGDAWLVVEAESGDEGFKYVGSHLVLD